MRKAFQSEVSALLNARGMRSPNEILLFDSLLNLMINQFSNINVGRLHGTSHLVTFKNSVNQARANANCELCDLLIVVFSHDEIRMTFHQSKYDLKLNERNIYQNGKIKAKLSRCDVEQWELLAKRPILITKGNVSKFNPPVKLLSSALNPSVGSYGVFYRNISKEYDLFYSIAEDLILRQAMYKSKKGSFRSNQLGCSLHDAVTVKGVKSSFVHSCLHIDTFFDCLLNFCIGTPLVQNGAVVDLYRLSWLKSLLSVRQDDVEALDGLNKILSELLVDDFHDESGGISNIVLIEVRNRSVF